METFDYLFKTYQDPTSNVYFFDLQKFQEDGTLTSNKITAKDLRDICSFHGHVLSMVVINAKQSSVAVEITGKSDHTEIELRVDDPNTLRSVWDHLVTNLSLEETEEAPTSTSKALAAIIAMLENRLKVLEAAANRADHLRCFLSYRFTPASEAIALNIQRFLTLLDVEVTTGAAYEPRRISDKVLDKLAGPHDFVVLLITQDGESFWTRDEISAARDRVLVPIVETGARFEPGIFGDIECITFSSSHIGDAFLKLLEAIHYMRRQPLRIAS